MVRGEVAEGPCVVAAVADVVAVGESGAVADVVVVAEEEEAPAEAGFGIEGSILRGGGGLFFCAEDSLFFLSSGLGDASFTPAVSAASAASAAALAASSSAAAASAAADARSREEVVDVAA